MKFVKETNENLNNTGPKGGWVAWLFLLPRDRKSFRFRSASYNSRMCCRKAKEGRQCNVV